VSLALASSLSASLGVTPFSQCTSESGVLLPYIKSIRHNICVREGGCREKKKEKDKKKEEKEKRKKEINK
jgi:hypothetical protein